MLEWLKRRVWKARNRLKRFPGSNPGLSAGMQSRQRKFTFGCLLSHSCMGPCGEQGGMWTPQAGKSLKAPPLNKRDRDFHRGLSLVGADGFEPPTPCL